MNTKMENKNPKNTSYFKVVRKKQKKNKEGNYDIYSESVLCKKGDNTCSMEVNDNGNKQTNDINKQDLMNSIGNFIEQSTSSSIDVDPDIGDNNYTSNPDSDETSTFLDDSYNSYNLDDLGDLDDSVEIEYINPMSNPNITDNMDATPNIMDPSNISPNIIDFNSLIPNIPINKLSLLPIQSDSLSTQTDSLSNQTDSLSNPLDTMSNSPYELSNLPTGIKVLQLTPDNLKKIIKREETKKAKNNNTCPYSTDDSIEDIIPASNIKLEELPVIKDKVSEKADNSNKSEKSEKSERSKKSKKSEKSEESDKSEKTIEGGQSGSKNAWKWF